MLGPVVRSVSGAELQAQLTQFTLILAVAGLVLYFLCFKSTREVVQRDVESPALKESGHAVWQPSADDAVSGGTVCADRLLRPGFAMYYARYVLGDAKLL